MCMYAHTTLHVDVCIYTCTKFYVRARAPEAGHAISHVGVHKYVSMYACMHAYLHVCKNREFLWPLDYDLPEALHFQPRWPHYETPES